MNAPLQSAHCAHRYKKHNACRVHRARKTPLIRGFSAHTRSKRLACVSLPNVGIVSARHAARTPADAADPLERSHHMLYRAAARLVWSPSQVAEGTLS